MSIGSQSLINTLHSSEALTSDRIAAAWELGTFNDRESFQALAKVATDQYEDDCLAFIAGYALGKRLANVPELYDFPLWSLTELSGEGFDFGVARNQAKPPPGYIEPTRA